MRSVTPMRAAKTGYIIMSVLLGVLGCVTILPSLILVLSLIHI